MISILRKYQKINSWYLYLLNIAIYCVMIFVQYRFIQTNLYYERYLRPLFHSQSDYVQAVAESRFFEIYNYLWIPVHVGAMILLISICLFIGLNVWNYSITIRNCITITSRSIIIFSLNSLIVTSLKACNAITYNANSIDDDYFFQSIGRLFIRFGFPDLIYSLLEKINIAEISFCILLSFMTAKVLSIKFIRSLFVVSCTYLLGTIIYICFTEFFNILLTT